MIENVEVAVIAINSYGDNRSFSQTWEPRPGAQLRLRDAIQLEESYIAELEENSTFHGEAGDETIVAWTILTCMNFTNGLTIFVPEKRDPAIFGEPEPEAE